MADAPAPHHALVMHFVAALHQRTLGCPTIEAHQHALQGFLDELTPWLSPADLPTLLGQPFTLFDHLAFTPNGEATTRTSRWRCPQEGSSFSVPGCASGASIRWCVAREERAMPRPSTPDSRPRPPAIPMADAPLTPSKTSASVTRSRYRRSWPSSSPCPPPSCHGFAP